MTESNQSEIILSRSELIYLLHGLNCKTAVGITLDELELPEEDLQDHLNKGSQDLAKHSLLPVPTYVQELVEAVGKRDMALIAVRGINKLGRQLFVFNFYKDKIIEHTLPTEGIHRLAVIDSFDALIQRFKQIVPLAPVEQSGRPKFKITQPEFEAVVNQAQSGQTTQAEKSLLRAGLPKEFSKYLLRALKTPEFFLSLACIAVENDTAVNASSASIFADQQSAWGIWPYDMTASPPLMIIFPSGVTDVYNAIQDWYEARKSSSQE